MKFLKVFLAGILAFVVGSFLMMFLWVFILLGIAGSMKGPVVAVKDNSILKIDLAETIIDAPASDPFSAINVMTLEATPQLPILKVLRAIEAAKSDARIKGIYLRMNGIGGISGAALVEELRAALVDFKQSGKFVVSYNETYSQGTYYLASVADKIYLQPEGGMEWAGMAFNLMFYKGLMDKLDVKAEIFRPTACKYKSAVEPYILDKMSDANRAQMQDLVSSMWSTITSAVSESRGMSVDSLNMLADNLQVSLPEDALKYRFVDGLIYEDQMKDVFKEQGVVPDSKDEYSFISLGDYAAQVGADLKNVSSSQVAIIYADGSIVDGDGYGANIFGNSLAKTIAGVRADDKVKAVVLRVNSPGGSALASDVIWREIELLKAQKPVVVSMGSYAASGGYYISCPADVVVADKMTLTGSIGVFGMFFNTKDALQNKLGITKDGVKSNTSAGMGMLGALTPAERASIMRGVDKVYTTFTSNVAKGRNLPIEKVLDIAGGRVWSGEDALSIGLIDTYGGLNTAIALAADKAELGADFRVVEVMETPTGLAAILASLQMNIRAHIQQSELGLLMKEYKKVQEITTQQGVVMYYPYTLDMLW
ncbi:MAG: signal peptide peptidase SppA [Alistipes sp.]